MLKDPNLPVMSVETALNMDWDKIYKESVQMLKTTRFQITEHRDAHELLEKIASSMLTTDQDIVNAEATQIIEGNGLSEEEVFF